MCINGEEIRIGRTGIYELNNGITVQYIGFIVKESDFTQDGKDYFIIGVDPNQGGFWSNADRYGNLEYVLANDKLIETEKYNIGKY